MWFRNILDEFKTESVEPSFPINLRSSAFGSDSTRAVDKKLKIGDVLLSIGEQEVSRADNDKLVLRKVMAEKFKVI